MCSSNGGGGVLCLPFYLRQWGAVGHSPERQRRGNLSYPSSQCDDQPVCEKHQQCLWKKEFRWYFYCPAGLLKGRENKAKSKESFSAPVAQGSHC